MDRSQDVIDGLGERGIFVSAREEAIVDKEICVEVVEDGDLAAGFAWGRDGALPPSLLSTIGKCSHAALVEVTGRLDECAGGLASLGCALQAMGGVAIRMEASGAASAWEAWLGRLEKGGSHALYEASVLLVADGEEFFTCGMHQFGLPDAQIATDDRHAATKWLDALCTFQLAEQPVLATGHTFRPDETSSRRVIERWPDHRHHPDDGRHNPFGLWRLLPPGTQGLQTQDPVLTIVPPLLAVLAASERSKGSALTKDEVDRLIEEAPAIAMEVADATALERSRGYADIEPRLAWEQWQLVRRTLT